MNKYKLFHIVFMLVIGLTSTISLNSCRDDEDENKNNINISTIGIEKYLGSWRSVKRVYYDGTSENKTYDHNYTFTLTKNIDEKHSVYLTTYYIAYLDITSGSLKGKTYIGNWFLNEYGEINIDCVYFYPGESHSISVATSGKPTLNNNRLDILYDRFDRERYGYTHYIEYLEKTTEPKHDFQERPNDNNNENNSSENGDTDFYEVNFNSTEYSNKIKVDFYFSENLSSATIKYGTTSSCSSSKSATVSAKCATATISGLKSGTKYYFKCTAKSKNGQSCTTGVYPAMTNY